ncbi:hypothetical protein BJ912DRAFT_885110 [Pholiota molesta]|nr:hypothetical protein BJ912DRAFT_885110 [Pholiota molesta]
MANTFPVARPGDEWGKNELLAFNIQVVEVDMSTFFGSASLPELTSVSRVILDNREEPTDSVYQLSKADIDFFAYLESATVFRGDEQPFVTDFLVYMLRMMGYDEGHRVVRTKNDMPLEMCGKRVSGTADVSVMKWRNGLEYLFLAKEYKPIVPDPEPQLIAGAISAFMEMEEKAQFWGEAVFESKTFPGMVMVGTAPTFYKIPVTMELLLAVASGQRPPTPTVVEKFIPPIPQPGTPRLVVEGMSPLVNRRIIMQCFQAFKQFVVSVPR